MSKSIKVVYHGKTHKVVSRGDGYFILTQGCISHTVKASTLYMGLDMNSANRVDKELLGITKSKSMPSKGENKPSKVGGLREARSYAKID